MFDTKAFAKATFVPRTATVPVPSLAAFFKEGEVAEFEVRGLTGNEMGRCSEAAKIRSNVEILIDANQLTDDHKKVLESVLGNTKDLSGEIIRRLEMLTIVFPDLGLPVWIKICEVYPVVFFDLTQKIMELTGQGKALEKPKPSGEMQASAL